MGYVMYDDGTWEELKAKPLSPDTQKWLDDICKHIEPWFFTMHPALWYWNWDTRQEAATSAPRKHISDCEDKTLPQQLDCGSPI